MRGGQGAEIKRKPENEHQKGKQVWRGRRSEGTVGRGIVTSGGPGRPSHSDF